LQAPAIRAVGDSSHVSFAASYASSPYYLMMPVSHERDSSTTSQVEFEALYSVRFYVLCLRGWVKKNGRQCRPFFFSLSRLRERVG